MRFKSTILAAVAALALTSCATDMASRPEARAEAVTVSTPETDMALDGAQVLAWNDATRSARFRDMEAYFPGLEVAPSPRPRALPQGRPLPSSTAVMIDAYVNRGDTAGVMVLQDGRVRYEKYGLDFGPEQRWTSFSVAKSLTSTLLGAAVRDGLVDMAAPVSRYIPGLRGSAYDEVTVEQLATMTSGVKWNENYTDPNSDVAQMFNTPPQPGQDQVVEYMKTLPREAPPGEKWVYKTGETNLIGVLVEMATGRTLAAYAKEKIVDPAGFADPLFWQTDFSNRNIGGCCLSLTLADYARFGQFVLDGGGQSVPAGWFAKAGAPQVTFDNAPLPGFGYGYQWWTYPGGNYGAQGIFGQSITLVPQQDMVIAILSNWPRATDQGLSVERLALLAAIAAGAN